MTIKELHKVFSPPLQWDKLFQEGPAHWEALLAEPEVMLALKKANKDYLHWEDLRYKDWVPKKFFPGFPDETLFWTLLKFNRTYAAIYTPIRNFQRQYFRMNISHYNQFLHTIDKEMAGSFMGVAGLVESDKKQYIDRGVIEEAIASSQLEGANTSRAAAKKMLLEGKKPHNYSECMIINNHQTMLKIEQQLYKEKLSLELICELHKMITKDTTLAADKQGVIRDTFDKEGERLKVSWNDQEIACITPDREFVEEEIPKLIAFANDEEKEDYGFIHPLIKAIMLHFWIGLLHPFEDGNGRLARILFYWYLLKKGYWAFAYLSLSEKIKKTPQQYKKAYIYSEQDDCDLTYFIDYNIKKLQLARDDFQRYIKNKLQENNALVALVQKKHQFNERQIKLLYYLNQKQENRTNLTAHQKYYAVKKSTAVTDLKNLVQKGFLQKKRQGRNTYYYATQKVSKIFE